MKTLLSIVVMLAAPVAASACDPLGVCSQAVAVQSFAVPQVAVQSHCAPAVVQSFGVQAVPHVQVQSFVTPFAVVPQAVVVQQAHAQRVRVQNVRQPRARSRTVVRQSIR